MILFRSLYRPFLQNSAHLEDCKWVQRLSDTRLFVLTKSRVTINHPFSAKWFISRYSRIKRPFHRCFEQRIMISPFLVAGDWKKVESLRFRGIREGLWIPPGWPTINFPIARQWLTHWRAVSFLLSYSNYGTCADSPFPDIPLRRREKRPFQASFQTFSRRFSPFEKTADFSPKSALFHLKSRHSPLFLE